MLSTPNIANLSAAIGEPARAMMLMALMDGRALTASELAQVGNVSKQTASAHLTKLLAAGLTKVTAQGRHKYFALAGHEIAQMLEQMMLVADRGAAQNIKTGPRDSDLRKARVCYDHLAGDMGVHLFDALTANNYVALEADVPHLTPMGAECFRKWGINTQALSAQKRPLCKSCLDWSARRSHLSGALGAAVLAHITTLSWARKEKNSRHIKFSAEGLRQFENQFGKLAPTA